MTAGAIETIQVQLQLVTNRFATGLQRTQNQLKATSQQMYGFGQVMRMPLENLQQMNKANVSMMNSGARAANGIRMFTHGLRGFRMEMLGVLFFGLMMKNFFTGLLQPVMDAFGVMDLFRVMLEVLFLPVMVMLFPYFLKFIEFFLNLPEGVQKAIGIFVLLALVFGAILFVVASVVLGVGSLILAFGLIAPIIGTIGLVVAAIIAIGVALFFIIKYWDDIKAFFITTVNFIKTKIGEVATAFYDKIRPIVNWFKERIINPIKAIFDGLWMKAQEIFNLIKEKISQVIDKLSAAINKVKEFFGISGKKTESTVSTAGASSRSKLNDFIWRPGQAPISISPQDNLVGFKGSAPSLGGEATIVNNYNVMVSDKAEFERLLRDHDARLLNQIKRNTA